MDFSFPSFSVGMTGAHNTCTSIQIHMHFYSESHALLFRITCTSIQNHMHFYSDSHSPSSYCEPFAHDEHGEPIAPCGAIANNLFKTLGITWYTDKNVKFRNPPTNTTLQLAFQGTAQPLFWQQPVYELDPADPSNNGFINDDLIVWMREAAFPNFKKLYGILIRAETPFSEGLPAGNYSVNIIYNFPVQYFQGRKEVVLSTVSWFGGQNHFLPIAYLVTGGLIFIAAIVLTVVYVKVGRDGKNMEE
uniref:Transmembrane protein 30C n=1 Tax=Astyanax mexicanus TaxID=7994 RepID=A0A8B9GLP4_ASTMX